MACLQNVSCAKNYMFVNSANCLEMLIVSCFSVSHFKVALISIMFNKVLFLVILHIRYLSHLSMEKVVYHQYII
jgi:hypothetical protein